MGPQAEFFPVDGFLRRDCSDVGVIVFSPALERQRVTVGDALNIFNNKITERNGRLMIPEIIEFILYPVGGFPAVVLPDDFIIGGQGILGYIHTAYERNAVSIGISDDTGFPVHQPIHIIRQNTNLHFTR